MADEKKPAQGAENIQEKRIAVMLDFDVWDENSERLSAGQVYDLPEGLARKLMEDGKAKYAGPMGPAA